MATIGVVKGLNGIFYVESKDGSIKILKYGDEIYQGDRVYGVGSNDANSSLEIVTKDDSFIVTGTNTLVFDTTADENTFGNEEATFKNNIWVQAETSKNIENIEENKSKIDAKEETEIGKEPAQSNDNGMDDFVARDLESVNVETSSLLLDHIELDNHLSSNFLEKDLFEELEFNKNDAINKSNEENTSLYQLENKKDEIETADIKTSFVQPLTIAFDNVEKGEKIVFTLLSANGTNNNKDCVATVSVSNGKVIVDDNSNGAYTITASNSEGIEIEQSETLMIRHGIGDFFDEQDFNLLEENNIEHSAATTVTTSNGNILYSELDLIEPEILKDDVFALKERKDLEIETTSLNEIDGFDSDSIFQFENLSFDLSSGGAEGTFDLQKVLSAPKELDVDENDIPKLINADDFEIDTKTSNSSKTQTSEDGKTIIRDGVFVSCIDPTVTIQIQDDIVLA